MQDIPDTKEVSKTNASLPSVTRPALVDQPRDQRIRGAFSEETLNTAGIDQSLTLEWRHRIDRWREELPRHVYCPLGTVPFTGFTTRQQLTAEQAAGKAFRPMPPGTAWGAKWEYGWFQGAVTLPDEATGQRIALKPDRGGESLVFIDGRAAGAIDQKHHHVMLSTAGRPGARYAVLVETYAARVACSPPVWSAARASCALSPLQHHELLFRAETKLLESRISLGPLDAVLKIAPGLVHAVHHDANLTPYAP